uniref:Uncharacterized protein n=1 Tax=Anopheles melas TaxID=34690 RepID=A0A182TR39_9DIPT
MEQLEREIRKEIDEMNTSVSLVDRLEAGDTMDDDRRDELLSSTRAVFDNINPNNVKNSLTDSQISIISKHDGYPDSGHFYSTPHGKDLQAAGDQTLKLSEPPVSNQPDSQNGATDGGVTAGKPPAMDGTGRPVRTGSKMDKQAKIRQSQRGNAPQDVPPTKNAPQASASLANLLYTPGGAAKRKRLPSTVVLGLIQLLLSVTLAALGGLVIARNASLAMAGTGLWCGAIAGIAGSLGLMNVKMAKTGFLAVNLICVASSTLGLALTGIGAVRDANLAQQDELIWGAVTAGTGLLVALAVHFLISVFSVYYSALKLCSRVVCARLLTPFAYLAGSASASPNGADGLPAAGGTLIVLRLFSASCASSGGSDSDDSELRSAPGAPGCSRATAASGTAATSLVAALRTRLRAATVCVHARYSW